MSGEQLRRASQHLQAAAEVADGDVRERLHEQSDHVARLAERDRGPDHGRLARHERTIDNIADSAGEAVATHVEDALESIHAYRETIEGV